MANDARLNIGSHKFTGWTATSIAIAFVFGLWGLGFLTGIIVAIGLR